MKTEALIESGVLYHYCTAKTFGKIINERSIRLSSVLKSNDSTEGLLLRYLLAEQIEKDPLNCQKEETLVRLMDRVREYRGGRAFCLTSQRDLLSQWCRYADK